MNDPTCVYPLPPTDSRIKRLFAEGVVEHCPQKEIVPTPLDANVGVMM
jgi:hypothetical protein